ncbi:hypothetical protein ABE425_03420 [Chryseobacterium cucumeris]|uniref:beta strand repeat-containing protein n=1 Tax=Chryseobacterium cucumeris TaxID=1813611 RepID=UPI0032082ABA
MKKNLLLAGLLTTFSLVAKSQVGINTTNPQGIFNIDGSKNNPTTGVPTAVQAKDDLVVTSNGNLGLGLTAPGTTLDVNGAITNRETALAVAGNAVTIPANVSLVRLTGAATANVAISAFAAPNPGQRLIVYNNTTGGFGATLDGTTVPNGKALEFIFSNSFWRSTDGGSVGASSVNLYNADGTLTGNRTVTQGANTLAFTGTKTNAFSVDGTTLSVDAANSRVGVGTTTPDTKLTISTPDNSFGLNHTNGTINLKTYIGGGTGFLGTTTANDLRLITNNVARVSITSGGNVGINTSTPGTTLDVDGAITNRETTLTVASNAVAVPSNVSLVRLTGAATANVAISAFAAPNPGQRLIVYNSTTGGFGATLDGTTVPNGEALEFVFSNGFWRSTDGGTVGATPVNIYTANGTLSGNRVVTTAGNSLSFTNGTNTVSVGTTGTEGIVRANGSSRGSFIATGGGAALNMYVNDSGKSLLTSTGNGTGMDIGTVTADPVSIVTNNTQRVLVTNTGNVGLNVVTPNPSAILDINGINRGVLLPRVLLTSTTDATTVPTPANGLLVYNNNASMAPYGVGIYYNTGTSSAPNWAKLAPQTTDYVLSQVVAVAATAPVDQGAVGVGNIIDNINLGLSSTVVVPANSTAKILMTYTVPMGTYPANNSNTVVNGYYGIRFLKNGVEAPMGSRKYSVPYSSSGSHMTSVSGSFSETVVNNGSSPINIVYTLNGYVEGTVSTTRFNMWASSGNNFNWGKGSLSGTVFAKDN